MRWPVPDGTVVTGEVVQLSALDPTADVGGLLRVLEST